MRGLLVGLRTVVCSTLIGTLTMVAGGAAAGAPQPPRPSEVTHLAPKLRNLELREASAKLTAGLGSQRSKQVVIVRLTQQAVGQQVSSSLLQQLDHREALDLAQQRFIGRIRRVAPETRLLARTQLVINAVFVEALATDLPTIAQDPEVARIAPVGRYHMHLDETVPQIGADLVHATGVNGAGVRVAVLDSGIDYTHAKLGGPGTLAAFEAAYGAGPEDTRNTTLDGLFPTARVVGGWDFLGEFWAGAGDPLLPDPDPIAAVTGSHGTHVADIIGGTNGAAPAVDLYALKVCSSVASACSGVALIQAMEFAVDPNGDGDTEDHVDIVNMSLGADYGQPFDDDLSLAVDNATALGVLTVASAGNGGDHPYIVGTPAAAPTALAVAQTQVASARDAQLLRVDEPADQAGNYVAVFQTWSAPLSELTAGPVQYGDGAGGALDGCSLDPDDPLGSSPFEPGSLAGRIVYVDRGACFFSEKIYNIGAAGGVLGIIGTVDDTPPFAGGFGGNTPAPDIPGFMISNADAEILRAGNASITFDPNNKRVFRSTMVSTSSRGPGYLGAMLKPEIGAPGASVSAQSGTGDRETTFGGTSGAAPMVSGSAALLMEAHPWRSPLEIKALLMNTAESEVVNGYEGTLAAVARTGGGEVRPYTAMQADLAAWSDEDLSGGLSFGFIDVASPFTVLRKRVTVHNYSNAHRLLNLSPAFRFADDEENGAVEIAGPERISVPAGASRSFDVLLRIDSRRLRPNQSDSGAAGGDPVPLTRNEYDGYLTLQPEDGGVALNMPWHVLPRQAAREAPLPQWLSFARGDSTSVQLLNSGAGVAQNDAYSLLALSPDLPEGGPGGGQPTPDIRAFAVYTFDGTAIPGCGAYGLAFALNSWEREALAHFPGSYIIALDVNQDGAADYSVTNDQLENFGFTGDHRNVTAVFDLNYGGGSIFFFTEHATHTANTVLRACASQLGDTPLGTAIDATVSVQDIYFGGPGDALDEPVTFIPGGERYLAGNLVDVPGFGHGDLRIVDAGPANTNPTEMGLLLLSNGSRPDSTGGATPLTEALFLFAQ